MIYYAEASRRRGFSWIPGEISAFDMLPKIVERSGTRTYELHLTQSSIITITRWRENTVRNVWGWVLVRLVAMERFGVEIL